MSDSIFCPICHHKNKPDAARCIRCGTPLTANKFPDETTMKVSEETASAKKSAQCPDYTINLPEDTLVLIVDGQEPIVTHNIQKIVIGRRQDKPSGSFVDLAPFGAQILGVSRQHVQITYDDGVWTLVDLGSTNGTWLNRLRLRPHESHELDHGDNLWLGHLKLSVCFGAGKPVREAFLTLKDTSATATSKVHLTPHYLSTHVIPYLQAIAEIEQLSSECRGAISEEVHIITVGAKESLILVQLDGISESINLIQHWLIPWRKRLHEEKDEQGSKLEAASEDALVELARAILTDIAPELANEEHSSYQEKFLPPLSVLATSPLELAPAHR